MSPIYIQNELGSQECKMSKTLKRNTSLDKLLTAWQRKNFRAIYLKTLSEDDLANLIGYLSDWYYNDDPLVDDSVFDTLFETLKSQNPKNKAVTKVRAPVSKNPTRKKIKLSCWMSSLDKYYPGGKLQTWVSKQNRDTFILSDKLDGFSIEIAYDAKGNVQLSSGGDGIYGQDLNHLIPFFDIPKSKSMVVRCEGAMIVSKHSKFASLFKTPRTALSNVFNSSKPNMDAVKATRLIALELIEPKGLPSSSQFKKLRSLGFEVPKYVEVPVEDVNENFLREYYATRISKSKYPIDGIVVKVANSYVLPNSGNPKYAIAFKENSLDNFAEAKVVRVEGNTSRTGRIVPTVHIEPTTVQGVTITKLTGHNYGYIRDSKINKGSIIKITRSGEVIPYIAEVVKPAKVGAMPDGEKGKDWDWVTDLDIKSLDNGGTSSDTIKIKKLEYFATAMGIVGLRGGTASTLYFNGITTPFLLVTKYSGELFSTYEGIGPKQAHILADAIDDVIGAGVELPMLATALSAFGPGIGYSKIKAVHDELNLNTLLGLPVRKRILKISSLHGFTDTSAVPIAENLDRLFQWIKKSKIVVVEPGIITNTNNILNGRAYMFTGFRSTELEDWIKRHGGKVVSTVGQCDTLIVKDLKAPPSSKVIAAQAKGKSIEQANKWIKFWVKDQSLDVFDKLL